jgi:hypothetical protein
LLLLGRRRRFRCRRRRLLVLGRRRGGGLRVAQFLERGVQRLLRFIDAFTLGFCLFQRHARRLDLGLCGGHRFQHLIAGLSQQDRAGNLRRGKRLRAGDKADRSAGQK